MSATGVTGFDPARLRAARTRAGLTQRDLAEALTLADATHASTSTVQQLRRLSRAIETLRTQVHYYETGQRVPRADMLHRLGVALGVDPLALLDPRTRVTLAVLRARRGLRQADVAEHLSCGRAYYARIEAGNAKPSPDDRRRLAALIQISPTELDRMIANTTTTVGSLMSRTQSAR